MKSLLSHAISICALVSAFSVYFISTPTTSGQTVRRKASKVSTSQSVASPEALPTTLFISEYIEGSATNDKALEIYNGTGATVNLAGYTVEIYSNGSSGASSTTVLTGSVPNGGVWVLAHPSASAGIVSQANEGFVTMNFNGDDAVVLKKDGVVVDSIGQVGVDPGIEWGTGNQSTADNTLVRNSNVCGGDTNPADAFNPATEWTGFAVNTFSNLGSHTTSCAAPPPSLSINDVTLAEGNSGTTTFAFTVSLSAPAPAGGVTFDIATADGVALDGNPFTEDSDFNAASLTGQTIPAGNSTYTFNVLVNGDIIVEPNETFFVNVTNITGAVAADAQGQGTITNDDLVPTAGPVSVRGRVMSASGRGVARAVVTLIDQNGNIKRTRANSFGYFKFDGVPSGESYLLSVSARTYVFSPRVVNASDDIVDLEIKPE